MIRLASFAACLAIACLALFAGPEAHATTIYKCTDAQGRVTMQNDTPCAAGMKQEVRTIGALPSAPPPAAKPVAAPEPVGPPPGARFELVRGPVSEALPDSKVPEAERKPPPPLFECKTWEMETYLSESDTPQDRCAPLNTVGLNGDPNFGAGEACEIKRDTCTLLTDKALCSAWQRRVDEAKFRMTYAAPADKDARKADYERQLAAFVDSTCR
jgi:hypothetical protein